MLRYHQTRDRIVSFPNSHAADPRPRSSPRTGLRPPSRAGQGLSDAPPIALAELDPSCNRPRGVPEMRPATAFIRLRPLGGTRAEGNPKTSLQAVDPDRVDEGPGGAGLARRRGARARDRRSALVRSSAEPLVGRGRAGGWVGRCFGASTGSLGAAICLLLAAKDCESAVMPLL